jgi:DNA-binding FadR family transcriptional regulator
MSGASIGSALADAGVNRPPVQLRPVRKAYEQIADQFRDLILVGELDPGARLPSEAQLASQLGASRATVRESLRLLAAEGLIRTVRGTRGGSYVARPTIDEISGFLRANINLLSRTDGLTLDELLEARTLFEVPAVGLASERGTPDGVARLRALIPPEPDGLEPGEQFVLNRDFHSRIVDMSRNRLLVLGAQPVFSALQSRLSRSVHDTVFHQTVAVHHLGLVAAIERGDADAAANAMAAHLQWLRPAYERAWRG